MAVKRTWQQRRRVRLKADGFIPWELKHYPKGPFSNRRTSLLQYALSRPYMRRMIKDRLLFLREATTNGWSYARYVRELAKYYHRKGWLNKRGKPSVWAMFRHFYDLSVDSGEYPEREFAKSHHTGEDKEKAKQQKAAWRQKQKIKRQTGELPPSDNPHDWLRQVSISLVEELRKDTPDPKRVAQFNKQINTTLPDLIEKYDAKRRR